MKRAVKSIFKGNVQDFSEFERQIAAALEPVSPPDMFVRELREKLLNQIEETRFGNKISTKNIFLLIIAGFLSIILVIATVARVIISLIAGIRLFDKVRSERGNKRKRATSTTEEG